jgi:hypothetical protein
MPVTQKKKTQSKQIPLTLEELKNDLNKTRLILLNKIASNEEKQNFLNDVEIKRTEKWEFMLRYP